MKYDSEDILVPIVDKPIISESSAIQTNQLQAQEISSLNEVTLNTARA